MDHRHDISDLLDAQGILNAPVLWLRASLTGFMADLDSGGGAAGPNSQNALSLTARMQARSGEAGIALFVSSRCPLLFDAALQQVFKRLTPAGRSAARRASSDRLAAWLQPNKKLPLAEAGMSAAAAVLAMLHEGDVLNGKVLVKCITKPHAATAHYFVLRFEEEHCIEHPGGRFFGTLRTFIRLNNEPGALCMAHASFGAVSTLVFVEGEAAIGLVSAVKAGVAARGVTLQLPKQHLLRRWEATGKIEGADVIPQGGINRKWLAARADYAAKALDILPQIAMEDPGEGIVKLVKKKGPDQADRLVAIAFTAVPPDSEPPEVTGP